MKSVTLFAALIVTGSLLSTNASAVEYQTAAAGACKSALPVFDGNVRTRPLGVQNEGNETAFVSCAQQVEFDSGKTLAAVSVFNTGSAPVDITCTMVDGYVGGPTAYQTKTTTVSAGSNTFVLFSPVSPATKFSSTLQAFNCSLPPSGGISRVATVTDN